MLRLEHIVHLVPQVADNKLLQTKLVSNFYSTNMSGMKELL